MTEQSGQQRQPGQQPGVGSTLGGRYELTELVATGGMGDVWAAVDSVLGRTVAVKVMRPRTTDEGAFAERFRDEARHTAALSHPNIAAVYDYGEDAGTAYLVMELVVGEPLSAVIARGPIDPERSRRILGQCALALASAHDAGVVHRDVKPANILLTREGRVKLTDFGIARATDGAGHTRTGEVMGTPQYLAPEQAMGKPVTGATDLYALGVVGHEMLTGARPFDSGSPVVTALAHINEPPPELPEWVGEPLRSAIEQCLAKEPSDRPRNAAALAEQLGMSVSGVGEALLATSVVPVTDLGSTQLLDAPTPAGDRPDRSAAPPEPPPPTPTMVVPPAAATSVYAAPPADPYAAQPDSWEGEYAHPQYVEPQYAEPQYAEPQYAEPAYAQPGTAAYPPERRRGGGWWWLPVVVLLAVLGLLWWQLAGPGKPTTETTPTVTITSTAPRPTTTKPSAPATTTPPPTPSTPS
ncbi:MAG TPA: serine/threonine-protein kinase, partial [Dermatophilaceae bacterium]|nr:serine/threonine-protein kinase [Dermatophilaceae bacterium]